jgi:pyruvate dehydrogenase E1 component alpha subunit
MAGQNDKARILRAYEEMTLIRRFEEKSGQLYGMGMIGGFCHLYIGQEAVAIGVQHNLNDTDSVVTSYRDHGIMLATGSDPKAVMAELLGKEGGCSKGKGGSMHMFDIPKKFYGGHGIVGAQVPIGTGISFADKYRNTGGVCVTYFGDGAANQGQVYESFNIAKLWNLPVLYVLENNEYGMGTSVKRSCATEDLYKRGEGYGIPGRRIDGMDYFKVYEAVAEALEYIRAGKGPMLLEMKTYRYRGHSMSDPGKYRSKEEVSEYKDHKDPINNLKNHILSKKLADEDALKDIDKKVKAVVAECVEFAQNSPEPDASELFTDVLKEG